jgi:hypothetical protein
MPKKEYLATVWYTGSIGIAYLLNKEGWKVFPVFTNSVDAQEIWEKEIDPIDEKTLKMRFIEDENGEYKFILYPFPSPPGKLSFGFYKSMRSSTFYSRFKKKFDGKAYFTFGIARDSPTTYVKSKLVTDIKFMKKSEVLKNSPEWFAEEYQRHARATYG